MSNGDKGPPNKYTCFTTDGINHPDDLATVVSNLYASGFTGTPIAVPNQADGDTWILIAGYGDSNNLTPKVKKLRK